MTLETNASVSAPAGGSYLRDIAYRGGLAQIGRWAMTYSLAIIFIWFGSLKFAAFEASGIAPLVMNSPMVGWAQSAFGVAGSAKAIGVIEITAGLLIAARPFNPRASIVGGAMAVITFLITLSFMVTTPGVIQPVVDSPLALSPMPGQFLLKDLVLLCVSIWIVGASVDEASARR